MPVERKPKSYKYQSAIKTAGVSWFKNKDTKTDFLLTKFFPFRSRQTRKKRKNYTDAHSEGRDKRKWWIRSSMHFFTNLQLRTFKMWRCLCRVCQETNMDSFLTSDIMCQVCHHITPTKMEAKLILWHQKRWTGQWSNDEQNKSHKMSYLPSTQLSEVAEVPGSALNTWTTLFCLRCTVLNSSKMQFKMHYL